MATGSLKDLSRALNAALSAEPSYPLPKTLLDVIQAYLNRHPDIDEYDSNRLHEELMNIHSSKVSSQLDKNAAFLAAFRHLMPAIRAEKFMQWWDALVRPTLDSLGQSKSTVADAKQVVLGVLVYDEDDDRNGEKKKAAQLITDRLFEIFLEKTKLLSGSRSAGYVEEERQRFVVQNVEAVLLSFGKLRPQQFMLAIDTYVVQKEYRLQALGLLCSYVRLQGPHLYAVVKTPLFEHLLQCLLIDTSTTVISLALTILIMFMPHICHYISAQLPKLFAIYARALCWERYGTKVEDLKFPLPAQFQEGKESHHNIRADSPISARTDSEGNIWQKLDSSFETTTSSNPDVSDYFTFLYGLYPINFLEFIREPDRVLQQAHYSDSDDLDLEDDMLRKKSEPFLRRHTIHPNFLTHTAEKELTDTSRWMKFEAAEITASCIGLVISSYSSRERQRDYKDIKVTVPDAFLATEDIPQHSLLSGEDDDVSRYDSEPGQYWRNTSQTGTDSRIGYPELMGSYSRRTTGYTDASFPSNRDSKTPDSPTIPPLVNTAEEEAKVRDMLALQESLRTGKHGGLNGKRNASSQSLASGQHSQSNTTYGSAAPSPRLDAYVQSLSKNETPRSPALRPAATDTQGTIAFLQREVMLLRNDLNFERYLKQQHLSHIGHLQRKHIKESAAEANAQDMVNTQKQLKLKLEEAKKAYARVKAEAISSKNHAKKWEQELNAKLRTLREEQRAWRAEEEVVKRELKASQLEIQRLKKLLSESESKELASRQRIQALENQVEELEQLRQFSDQLQERVKDQEARAEEFEMQKLNEEAALTQLDRIKMRFQAREQDREKMKRAYEQKVQELEAQLTTARQAVPPQPGPNFQAMIDNALAAANARFASLKKSHTLLFARYTELEMKYLELQAISEIDEAAAAHGHHAARPSTASMASGVTSSTESPSTFSQDNFNERSFTPQPFNQFMSPGEQYQRAMSPTAQLDTSIAYTLGGANYFSQQQGGPPSSAVSPIGPQFQTQQHASFHLQQQPPFQLQQHQLQQQPTKTSSSQPPTTGPPTGALNALSITQTNASSAGSGITDPASKSSDSLSVRTVTSTTSSERKKKEQVRMRGRGGAQNYKKNKEPKTPKEEKPPKERRLKFPTGSGLAGIRNFVQ